MTKRLTEPIKRSQVATSRLGDLTMLAELARELELRLLQLSGLLSRLRLDSRLVQAT